MNTAVIPTLMTKEHKKNNNKVTEDVKWRHRISHFVSYFPLAMQLWTASRNAGEINDIDTSVMKEDEFLYISDGIFVWTQIHNHYANKWRLAVAASESLNSGGGGGGKVRNHCAQRITTGSNCFQLSNLFRTGICCRKNNNIFRN
jgi:hypothetical protein